MQKPEHRSPTPEEKAATEGPFNRKQRRGRDSAKKKVKRAEKKTSQAPLLARIDALVTLCRAQGEELARTRRELRGANARSETYWHALDDLGAPWAQRKTIKEAGDAAAEHASLPQPNDTKVRFQPGNLPPSTVTVGYSRKDATTTIEIDPLPIAPKGDTKP